MRYQQLPYSPELDDLQQAGLLYYGIVGKDAGKWYRLYPHQLSPSACHKELGGREPMRYPGCGSTHVRH